jgi:hypothetical protein
MLVMEKRSRAEEAILADFAFKSTRRHIRMRLARSGTFNFGICDVFFHGQQPAILPARHDST